MRRFEMRIGIRVVVLLAALSAGPLQAGEGGGVGRGGKTTRVIITGDRAVVNGDTVRLDDLKDALRDLGSLDIEIIEDVDVSRGEEGGGGGEAVKRNEVVRFGEDVVVEENEKVAGDVVVFGGSARIAGVVSGDVVVLGGDLTVEETGDVRGSAVCFGGEIEKRPGGRIGSEEVSFRGGLPITLSLAPFIGSGGPWSCWNGGVGFFARIVLILFVLLLGAATLFLFPGAVDRVVVVLRGDLLRTGLIGLLGEILILPLFLFVGIVLCVSLIGIPLLFFVIPLGILAVIAAFWLGYVGAGLYVGRRLAERAAMSGRPSYRFLSIGIVALLAFYILAGIAGLAGGSLWPLRATFGFLSGLVTWLAATLGLGAVILTRFGTRAPAVAVAVGAGSSGEEDTEAES